MKKKLADSLNHHLLVSTVAANSFPLYKQNAASSTAPAPGRRDKWSVVSSYSQGKKKIMTKMSNCAFESHRNTHRPTYKFLLFLYMWGITIKYLQFGIYFSPHTAAFDSKRSIWAGVKITALKAEILMVRLVPETENRCLNMFLSLQLTSASDSHS